MRVIETDRVGFCRAIATLASYEFCRAARSHVACTHVKLAIVAPTSMPTNYYTKDINHIIH